MDAMSEGRREERDVWVQRGAVSHIMSDTNTKSCSKYALRSFGRCDARACSFEKDTIQFAPPGWVMAGG